MTNSIIFGAPIIYQNMSPPYFRFQPKIQKSGSRFLLGFWKCFQRIPGNGPLPDLWVGSPTQQYDFRCENLAKIQSSSQKLFKLWLQTDTQFCNPIWGDDIFYTWKFIPFPTLCSFVCFAHSFTPFVKDEVLIKFQKVTKIWLKT